MGNIEMRTEVNLNDRSEFVYPLLIGRSFLEGHAVVDTSQRFMMLD
ncbi:RimK/LysX family protein [Oleiphilus sp. HI0080]